MASRDILVLNTTASRAETQQGSDTVVIRGNSSEALSVENSSGTTILSVNTISSSVDVAGKITATGNVSSSISSTGSFGRLESTTLIGDAFNLTNTAIEGTISSSSQIASQISGSFRSGFEFDGTIGSVAGQKTTASFDRIVATSFSGSAANLSNTVLEGTLSSSAQIATRISGAFTSGFEFDGTIKANPAGTFTVGPNPNTEAYKLSATGTPSAGIKWAGLNYPFTAQGETETFDGTSFSEVNDLNTDRYYGSHAGTQNAAVTAGGEIPFVGNSDKTEEWNGTNWSEVNDTPAAINVGNNSFGFSQTAHGVINSNTEQLEYNGTNWSDLGSTPFSTGGARAVAGGGTEAALAVVRVNFSSTSPTKEYDGSSWSEGGATTVGFGGGAMAGIQNDAVVAGTTPTDNDLATGNMIGCSENYNGTSWSVGPGLGRSVAYGGFFGRTGTGAVAGGAHFVGGLGMGSPNYIGTALKLHAGTIAQTTASFARLEINKLTGDVSQMTNLVKSGLVSGSAQIADRISGSFNKGFEFDGHISGSVVTTASFANVFARKAVGDISQMINKFPKGVVSGSGTIASRISGSFADRGFEFTGTISGSATSTGSFDNLFAKTIHGDISNLTNILPTGTVSGSAQIASRISGSFNKGFEFQGTIETSPPAWSLGATLDAEQGNIGGVAVGQSPNAMLAHFGTAGDVYNGTSWSEITAAPSPTTYGVATGDYNAALFIGGSRSGSISWNGSNWSEEASTNRANTYLASGAGTTEAALVFGGGSGSNDSIGHVSAETEMYDGSSWSEVNDMLIPKYKGSQTGIGSQNSTISYGGCGKAQTYDPPSPFSEFAISDPRQEGTHLEEWNGTNWTYLGDFYAHPQPSFFNHSGAGVGTTNAASFYGGYTQHFGGSGLNSTHFHWDGTAMSNGVSMLIPKSQNDGAGQGGASSAHSSIFGFYPGYGGSHPAYGASAVGLHEQYEVFHSTASFGRLEAKSISGDGSNLTNSAITGTISGSKQIASRISGSFTSGFTFDGTIQNTPYSFTEIAALNTGRQSLGASGIKTAGLVFGGYGHPQNCTCTETFNGTSWSEVNDMIAAGRGIGGSGTSTATVAFGGSNHRNQYTEEWNGTNWTEVNDMIRSDFACQAADIGQSSEAAIAAGSCTPYTINDSSGLCNEEWNGTNWATANALIHTAAQTGGGAGSANAGITAGGFILPGYPGAHRCTQLWNGVNWSEAAAALPPSNHRGILYGWGGSQNDAIITSGCSYQGGLFDTSYCYNGISWAAGSAIGTFTGANAAGVFRHKGAGTSVDNSFFAGGVGGGLSGNNSAGTFGFCTDNGVATASFDSLSAIEITASVDGMTNIPEPAGTISSSVQIASRISGSFNKGFEFSGEIRSLGAFSAGGDFPGSIKHNYHGGLWGTQNSALLGGGIGIYQSAVCDTYSYNGTSWSDTGANMNDSKGGYTAHGTENAALAAGGIQYQSHIFQYLRINTEEWNGSAWSFTTNLPHQLTFLNNQKGGTQNASLIAGGYTGAGSVNQGSGSEAFQRTSLAWDGLSYSVVASMDNERGSGGFVGTMNSGLSQGGNNALGHSTCTEEWNGSSWSDAAASNFPTGFTQTVGTSNNAMHTVDANSPVKTGCTDFYNGVSWNTGPIVGLSTPGAPKQCAGSAGSTSAGVFMTYGNSCVEHFDEHPVTSSIGRVDADELSLESDTDLIVNESLQIPQYVTNPPITSSAGEVWYNATEEKLYFTYDINSWTEVANTNSGHAFGGYAGGTGDGLIWGGGGPSPFPANTELWNGTSWTEVNDLNTGGTYMPGGGNSNAAIAAGRMTPAFSTKTEIWDGTSWTEVNDGAISYGASFAGTVNAAFQAGGRHAGNAQPDDLTKEWNGTNWYAGGDQISAKADHAAMLGTQNAAKHMGGGGGAYDAPLYVTDLVEDYNGTSFSTATSLPVKTHFSTGGGTQNAGIMAGGLSANSANTAATYEWNGVSFHQAADLGTGRKTNDLGDGSQSSFQVSGGGPFNNPSQVKTEQYTVTGIGCHCIGGV